VSVAALTFSLPIASQLVDRTLEDIVDTEITEQVEQDVAEALEDLVEQQVEGDVAEQVEADVAGAVEQQLESEIVDAVQQQVESGVVATIATQVESTVSGAIGAQLRDVGRDIGNAIDDTVRGVADGDQPPGADAGDSGGGGPFAADVDALGRAIEREVWIILVPVQHAGRIASWGFTIRERHDLATLERVLLKVAAPEDRDIAQAALDLALEAPGTEVDFNHVYRPGAEFGDADSSLDAAPVSASGVAGRAPALAVGIVDTAIALEHEALVAADIVQRDFVPFTADRPTAHGTAVASLLVGDAPQLRPQLHGGRLYAASVFFSDSDGNDASTAASLTVASEWLAAEGVGVINMSLAGPANRVLEAAIAALAARGVIVVAAVGNNGPSGEPLYPAAYPNVVGVTAVDVAHRIYRYANRGPCVDFAAPGVDVPVARSSGGYRELTGTSVAAPHAAAVIASALASHRGEPAAAILRELELGAHDLGTKGFDDVFGFGLIAPPAATSVRASR
jgi:subtilisin family serine protease